MEVKIEYVDGTVFEGSPEQWTEARADGVDRVTVEIAIGTSTFNGHSVYWLYCEDGIWVAGMASFHYNPVIPPEVLFLPDGTQGIREIEYVADMSHSAIKLGWWRPNEERPAWR